MKALFRVKLKRAINTIRATKIQKYLLFLVFSILIFLLIGFVFIQIFAFLYNQDEFPLFFKLFLSEKILLMVFLTLFMMLILSTVISTLNIFFLSKDLNLLFTSPLKSSKIFLWKSFEVGTNSSAMVIFFSLPVLIAYCYYFANDFYSIAAIILTFLLYIVCGVLLGIIIGLIIPSFFSVKKLQPLLSLVSIIIISFIVIFLRLLRPERFANPDIIDNLLAYMRGLDTQQFSIFPFYWLAKALNFISIKNFSGFFKITAVFLLTNGFIFTVIWILQKKFYLNVFDKLYKKLRVKKESTWEKILAAGDYSILFKKEVKSFFRNSAQWSQLLIIGAIVVVFIINMKGIPLPHPSIKKVIIFLNLGMAAFIVAGLNSRFTFTTIPMENPGLVHLLASPFRKIKILRFKFLFYLIPQLFIGFLLFFTGDLSLNFDSYTRITGCIFLIPVISFLTILALYFSLKISEQLPITPQHLIMSKPGISYMLWSLVYITINLIYFVRPGFLYYYSIYQKSAIPITEILLWLIVFLIINTGLTFVFYKKSVIMWQEREFL